MSRRPERDPRDMVREAERSGRDIQRMRALTRVLDELVPVPGTRLRLGLDSLIGLIPGGGDVVGGALAAYAVLVAWRLGAPAPVLARIAGNVLVDMVVGAVPLLGDLFDVGWKANRRNLRLLEDYLADPRAARRRSRTVLAVVLAVLGAAIVGAAVAAVWLARALLSLL